MIREAKPDPHRTREIKVSLPLELHIRLHEGKILHGERISDVVARALESYLKLDASREAPP